MKIIRFFLRHLLLVTFFFVTIYVYTYWDNLTGEDTPVVQAIAYLSKEFDSVDTFVEGIKTKQSYQEERTAEEGSVHSSLDETVGEASQFRENVLVTPEVEQSLNLAVNHQTQNQPDIPVIVTESNTEEDSNRTLWIDARKAFYMRDYASSITRYQQLIANSPDNYDAYGELGNVYFSQGKQVEAAAAYFGAASILVKLSHVRHANSLLPLLYYLDAEKAVQLKALMASGQS